VWLSSSEFITEYNVKPAQLYDKQHYVCTENSTCILEKCASVADTQDKLASSTLARPI